MATRQPSSRPAAHALGLALGLFLLGGCGGEDPSTGSPQASTSDTIQLADLGAHRGADGAPVTVVEFSDFGCVFCARFHEESYGALHDEFVASGDVAWKYVPITVGGFPNGFEAALSAECVGEQDGGAHFARIRDRLCRWRRRVQFR